MCVRILNVLGWMGFWWNLRGLLTVFKFAYPHQTPPPVSLSVSVYLHCSFFSRTQTLYASHKKPTPIPIIFFKTRGSYMMRRRGMIGRFSLLLIITCSPCPAPRCALLLCQLLIACGLLYCTVSCALLCLLWRPLCCGLYCDGCLQSLSRTIRK